MKTSAEKRHCSNFRKRHKRDNSAGKDPVLRWFNFCFPWGLSSTFVCRSRRPVALCLIPGAGERDAGVWTARLGGSAILSRGANGRRPVRQAVRTDVPKQDIPCVQGGAEEEGVATPGAASNCVSQRKNMFVICFFSFDCFVCHKQQSHCQ